MKRGIQTAFATRENSINRFSFLILLLLSAMNLSGQKIKTVLAEKWTTTWVTDSRDTYSYDVNNHIINILTESWNGASFENKGQINYTINLDGTINQMVIQVWNSGVWTDFLTNTFTYNSSKKVLTTVSVTLASNTKQTNSYDSGTGFLLNSLNQSWDGATYQNSTQSNYTNDSNGNPTQEITQQWDGISAWTNLTRSTSTYNGSNKVLTTISDKWKSGAWEPDHQDLYTYDGTGLITLLDQTWNGATWDDKNRTIFSNNLNGTVSQATDQSWSAGVWNNVERYTYTYDSATGFSELSSGGETDFTIYPNPASDFIRIKTNKTISGSDYYFADQSGKTVLRGKITSETNSIDITSLANGVYFLHFGEGREFTFKVVKAQLK
jgi:hypothetical protein